MLPFVCSLTKTNKERIIKIFNSETQEKKKSNNSNNKLITQVLLSLSIWVLSLYFSVSENCSLNWIHNDLIESWIFISFSLLHFIKANMKHEETEPEKEEWIERK